VVTSPNEVEPYSHGIQPKIHWQETAFVVQRGLSLVKKKAQPGQNNVRLFLTDTGFLKMTPP
jgi:hypothetical protein